jgi:hypothetical protein
LINQADIKSAGGVAPRVRTQGATIDDQKNLTRGSNDQAFKEFDEDIGIDTAFFLDHETHVTARRNAEIRLMP